MSTVGKKNSKVEISVKDAKFLLKAIRKYEASSARDSLNAAHAELALEKVILRKPTKF